MVSKRVGESDSDYRERRNAAARADRVVRTAYMRDYRAANRERMNAQAKASHAKARKARSPEKRHEQHLKYTYGISREQYLAMLDAQHGRCAICGSDTPRGRKAWHVDHDHVTGKIRGLLCNSCNPKLGWYEAQLDNIKRYLQRDTTW